MKLDPDKIYLLDGGFFSHLEKSLPKSVEDPLWGCGALHTHPDQVVQVHRDYLEAGSMILTTNTYQSSVPMFIKHLPTTGDRDEERDLDAYGLYETSVKLCDQAYKEVHGVERYGPVAGSIGPYGACQGDGSEYSGDYVDRLTTKELEHWHFQRIKRLMIAGVDLFAVETIPSVKEAVGKSGPLLLGNPLRDESTLNSRWYFELNSIREP